MQYFVRNMIVLKNIQLSHVRKGLFTFIISLLIILQKETVNAAAIDKDEIQSPPESVNRSICLTKECQDIATDLSNNLDLNVDPCKNFYKYACGNFEKRTNLLKSNSAIDQFTIIMDRIIEQIKKVVEEKIDSHEARTFQLVKTYYSSCINSSAIESQGLKPLQDILKALGGWPVILGDSWKEENFSWERMDQLLQSLGYSPKYIFFLYVLKDVQNPEKNLLYLSPMKNDINAQLRKGLENNVTKAYYEYMVEVAVLLGADRNRAITELKEALLFEIKLANATTTTVEDVTPEMIVDRAKIKDLQKLYPYISWLEYINNVTSPNGNFSDNDEIHIDIPLYIFGLKDALNNTTKRAIANYMIWKAISDSIDYLPDEIRSKKLLLEKAYSGKSEIGPKEKECLQTMILTNEGLAAGTNAMYVKEYFKENAKEKVAAIVSHVQKYYDDVLKKVSWLSEETRETALKKNKFMNKIIGYPDELLNVTTLDKHYESLQLIPNNYFHNALQLKKFAFQKSISNLKKLPNETFWLYPGISTHAYPYYNSLYNTIILPASSLQHPFFNEHLPSYINYGGLGFLISHEITHSFVSQDIQLDENGSIKYWWTEDDQSKFEEKSFCFMVQYNNFTETDSDARPIGLATVEENIADNEGVRAAFNAYTDWKSRHEIEPRLPLLNHTDEQLFWISAANTLCSKKTQEIQEVLLSTDLHAPEEVRVIGLVSNSKDFAKAFNCDVGSPMNPEEKCFIW